MCDALVSLYGGAERIGNWYEGILSKSQTGLINAAERIRNNVSQLDIRNCEESSIYR